MNKILDYSFSTLGDPLNLLNLCITSYELYIQKLELSFDSDINRLSDEQLRIYDEFRWILSSLRDLKTDYEQSFESDE